MFKYGGAEKFRRASPQVFKINFLSLGKREPVRQLKKAGGVYEMIQQILYTHPKNENIKILRSCDSKVSETFI
jgi:hypothetical protein